MRASKRFQRVKHSRCGAVLVWAAGLLVLVFSLAAFAVDLGYMTVVATQLQNAADGAALSGVVELPHGPGAVLAEVQDLAAENRAAGSPVSVAASDVEFGWYDTTNRTFTTPATNLNAIRVTARTVNKALFFAPILGQKTFTMARSATAVLNPRDIAFVVDLSGSMNDDTEPCWATDEIAAKFAPLGYPTVSADLMQDVYSDFGYGTFPGASQYIFQSLGVAGDPHYAYAEATKDGGPLSLPAIDPLYRIMSTDDEATRRTRAYSWLIDRQIAVMMPNAKPTPDSMNSSSFAYWEKYLDYVINQWEVGISPKPPKGGGSDGSGGGGGGGGGAPPPPSPPSGFLDPKLVPHYFDFALFNEERQDRPRTVVTLASASHLFSLPLSLRSAAVGSGPAGVGVPRNGSTDSIYLPPGQDWHRIDGFNNPNYSTFPSASYDDVYYWHNTIGYVTYVQFMMDWGRDRSPVVDDGSNAAPGAGTLSPLSLASPDCPLHSESTPGGTFDFPPREQPMHAVRRALIAVTQEIKTKNAGLASGTGDRVCLITYDGVDANHQPTIVVSLTDNFDSVMTASTRLQAVSDIGNTTATECGIITARQHIASPSGGGQGRRDTTKVIVLCTDGVPNVWQSSSTDINAAIGVYPSGDYYASDYVWYNSVLRQAADMQRKKVKLYPVGMGLGADLGFMDRVARLAQTDVGGLGPRGTGNPADYEQQLINIFQKIINTRSGKLVK